MASNVTASVALCQKLLRQMLARDSKDGALRDAWVLFFGAAAPCRLHADKPQHDSASWKHKAAARGLACASISQVLPITAARKKYGRSRADLGLQLCLPVVGLIAPLHRITQGSGV